MLMKLNSVRMAGFKVHVQPKEIVFDGNTKIYAENGKGKTTVGDAVAWCFLGTDINGTENVSNKLINNLSNDMEVAVEFEHEGKEHSLVRMKKGAKTTIILDHTVSDQLEIMNFIKHKELFLSIFNPMYFSALAPKLQKELLQKYLGEISVDVVLESMGSEGSKLVKDGFRDAKTYITRKRNRLQDLNDRENFLKGFISAKAGVSSIPPAKTFSDERYNEYLALQADLEELEQKPMFLHDITQQLEQKDAIQKQLYELENFYNNLKNKPLVLEEEKLLDSKKKRKATLLERHKMLKQNLAAIEKISCPNCSTEFEMQPEYTAKLTEELNQVLTEGKQITEEIKKLESDIGEKKAFHFQQLDEELEAMSQQIEVTKSELQTLNIAQLEGANNLYRNELMSKKADIQTKLNQILTEKQQVDADNAQREALINQAKSIETELENAQKELDGIDFERATIKNQIDLANKFNSKRLQMQSTHISQYLDKVSIQFQKIIKSTGEVKDDFKIQYEEKDFNLLSTSERIKAGLEIAKLLASFSDQVFPIFVDNAESITHIPPMDTQIIAAYVKEGQELTVA